MAIFTHLRTARKPYRCSACDGQIRPGQRYQHVTVTPRDPELGDAGGKRWGRLRYHLTFKECA